MSPSQTDTPPTARWCTAARGASGSSPSCSGSTPPTTLLPSPGGANEAAWEPLWQHTRCRPLPGALALVKQVKLLPCEEKMVVTNRRMRRSVGRAGTPLTMGKFKSGHTDCHRKQPVTMHIARTQGCALAPTFCVGWQGLRRARCRRLRPSRWLACGGWSGPLRPANTNLQAPGRGI